jgi:hypothetical protein
LPSSSEQLHKQPGGFDGRKILYRRTPAVGHEVDVSRANASRNQATVEAHGEGMMTE